MDRLGVALPVLALGLAAAFLGIARRPVASRSTWARRWVAFEIWSVAPALLFPCAPLLVLAAGIGMLEAPSWYPALLVVPAVLLLWRLLRIARRPVDPVLRFPAITHVFIVGIVAAIAGIKLAHDHVWMPLDRTAAERGWIPSRRFDRARWLEPGSSGRDGRGRGAMVDHLLATRGRFRGWMRAEVEDLLGAPDEEWPDRLHYGADVSEDIFSSHMAWFTVMLGEGERVTGTTFESVRD